MVRGYRRCALRERVPDLAGRFPTRGFSLNDFSTDEFVDAHKLQMVDLLLEDEARGIGIAPPPIATPEGLPLATPVAGGTNDPTAL